MRRAECFFRQVQKAFASRGEAGFSYKRLAAWHKCRTATVSAQDTKYGILNATNARQLNQQSCL